MGRFPMGTFPVKTVDSRKDKETKWTNKSPSLVTITAMAMLLNVQAVRTGTTAMAMLLIVKDVRTGTAMAVAEHTGCTDGHRYGCC